MEFVDTNVFLRFLLADHPTHSSRSAKLFQAAKNGQVKLWTTEWVISEIIWVLESSKHPKTFIIETIKKILNTSELQVNNKDLVFEAIGLYETLNIEFEDALNCLLARKNHIASAYSYDPHLSRVSWIKRKLP